MVAKVVIVAVVVSALEPIQFQRCKTQLDARILLLQLYMRNFRFLFTTLLLAEAARNSTFHQKGLKMSVSNTSNRVAVRAILATGSLCEQY